MQMIRQYAVPHDQIVQVTVPEEFNNKTVEIQVILVEEPKKEIESKPKSGLGRLVGKYKHYTAEQNEQVDRELKEVRDSWERPIL